MAFFNAEEGSQMKKNWFIICILLLLSTMAAFAADELNSSTYPEPSKQMLQDFEQYVQKAMKEWNIPGMAIGIVQGDKVVYAKGFGVKTLGSDDPVDLDTIFQIGSVTKSFTAALTAMLVDEGKFKWDDKVSDHLPNFMLYDPWVTREFQVVDLMAQRSGLPSHAGDSLFKLGYDRAYITQVLRYIQPVSSFRSQYAYVNVLFLYVADLIKNVTGKSWEQNVVERIFKPLSMSNSSTDMQSFVTAKNVASPHVKVNSQIAPLSKDWPYFNWSYIAGPAGAINSNLSDMVKWLSFQVNNGKVKGKQLVSEANMNFTHSPKTPSLSSASGGNMFYSLGWVYQENNPLPIIWHDGEATGMKSTVAFIPKAKIGIVILSNSITDVPELLMLRFFDQYFGKKLVDYSGEILVETQKAEQQSKSQEPIPPKNPEAPLPLEKYAGNYSNKVYGNANISLVEGKLMLTMGNNGVFKMTLGHWDKDMFVLFGSLYSKDEKNGFIQFKVDPEGNVQSFTLDPLNEKFQKL